MDSQAHVVIEAFAADKPTVTITRSAQQVPAFVVDRTNVVRELHVSRRGAFLSLILCVVNAAVLIDLAVCVADK